MNPAPDSSTKPTRLRYRALAYWRLMRADKPIGTLLLLYPTLWAIWIATKGQPEWPDVLAFALGTFFMRSAGCIINDWADKDFDSRVARTKDRPMATGEITPRQARRLLIVLCILAALCLIPFSWQTWLMSLPALALAGTYPFAKRWFPIPQLYLGLAFSWGMLMAFVALQNDVPEVAWWLYAANLFWTLAYDTAYAMADKPDDLNIGIKTSAITFGDWDAEMVLLAHFTFDILMLKVGWLIGATWVFWTVWVLVLYWQWKQYTRVFTRDRDTCLQVFLDNNKIGATWLAALAAHFAYF